jgi:opacity protein-like surface antigen
MFKHLTAAALAVLVLAAPARADWLLTPYAGLTFGGNAPDEKPTYGVSFAYLGAGIFGLEFDAAITPNFFDADDSVAVEDSNVSTVMGNLILSAPGAVRPYVSGGIGLIRARATSVGNVFDVDDNSFGVNVGGGLMGMFGDHVGLRGDVRYFRGFQDFEVVDDVNLDLSDFDFWRGSLGLTFRF